jgi:polygalacturonase
VTRTIADLERVLDKGLQYKESSDIYTKASFRWGVTKNTSAIQMMQSTDKGKTWSRSSALVDPKKGTATISNLAPGKLYQFRLSVNDGSHKGVSNTVQFYSGKMDVKNFGVIADGNTDNTDKINEAIEFSPSNWWRHTFVQRWYL